MAASHQHYTSQQEQPGWGQPSANASGGYSIGQMHANQMGTPLDNGLNRQPPATSTNPGFSSWHNQTANQPQHRALEAGYLNQSSANWGQPSPSHPPMGGHSQQIGAVTPPSATGLQQALSLSQRAAAGYAQRGSRNPAAFASTVSPHVNTNATTYQPPQPTLPTTPTDGMDNATVDRMVNRVAYGVLDRLNDGEFVGRFTQSKELLADNQQLAAQVQHLLQENQHQQEEIAYLQHQCQQFKRLFGNMYWRIEQ